MKTKWLREKLSRRRQELSKQQAELTQKIERLRIDVAAGVRGAPKKLARCQRSLREVNKQFGVYGSKSRSWNSMTW